MDSVILLATLATAETEVVMEVTPLTFGTGVIPQAVAPLLTEAPYEAQTL
jgi:acyl-CoA hydrolase